MVKERPDCLDAVRICIKRFDQMGLDVRKPVFGGGGGGGGGGDI